MGRIAELNKRLEAKRKEIDDDLEERQRAHEIIQRRNTRWTELADELGKARARVRRKRAAIKEVRQDLKELEENGPDDDATEAEIEELRDRLDHLAGIVDEAVSDRDRILARLDRLGEKSREAREYLDKVIAELKEDREAVKRLRAKRKQAREERARGDVPSPHFTYAEFNCNDGTPMPEESKAAVDDLCLNVYEPLRDEYGACFVNSGHRTESWNRHVGGVPNSVHRYDYPGRNFKAAAGDVKFAKGTPRQWFDSSAGKADGRGLYSTFIHDDNRSRIGWPDSTWSG